MNHTTSTFQLDGRYRGRSCTCGFTSSTGLTAIDAMNMLTHLEEVKQEPQPAGQSVEELSRKLAILSFDFYTSDPHEGESLDLNLELAKNLLPALQSFATSQQQARERREEEGHIHLNAADLIGDLRKQIAMDTECIERIRTAAIEDMFRADKAEAKVVELECWKRQAMFVMGELDSQKLATMLGATLGDSCNKVINERVPLLVEAVKTLRGALGRCEERFKQYAESHFKKKTVEGDIKGLANFEMVHTCVDALESTKEFA